MGRYNADPSKVSASITIFPKGDVELKCGKPKAFERTNKQGNQSYGVRVPLTRADGKRSSIELYMHSEGGQMMAKRFQMAVAGMTVNEENEAKFDSSAAGLDWSFDPETGDVGAAWAAYEGLTVVASVDVELVKNDKDEEVQRQVWKGWSPLK